MVLGSRNVQLVLLNTDNLAIDLQMQLDKEPRVQNQDVCKQF